MNIVAVRCMMETVTPQLGVEYAKNFGITTLTSSDYNAATALGGLTEGVTNLELTSAFATIANQGMYTEPIFFTKIIDRNGKVLINNEPATRRRPWFHQYPRQIGEYVLRRQEWYYHRQQRYLVCRIHALLYSRYLVRIRPEPETQFPHRGYFVS